MGSTTGDDFAAGRSTPSEKAPPRQRLTHYPRRQARPIFRSRGMIYVVPAHSGFRASRYYLTGSFQITFAGAGARISPLAYHDAGLNRHGDQLGGRSGGWFWNHERRIPNPYRRTA